MTESRRTDSITPQQLRDKALLALEDAIQECRYRTPRRSEAIRFAMFYLWAYSGGSREPFDDLWRALGEPKSLHNFGYADTALGAIYRALGLARPDEVSRKMWRRRQVEEGCGAPQ